MLADAQTARREAAAILSQSRFHNPSVPRPLHSLLHDVGSGLQGVGDAITGAASALGSVLPGGAATAWVLLALLVIGVVWLVARRYTGAALAAAGAPGGGARGRAARRGRARGGRGAGRA